MAREMRIVTGKVQRKAVLNSSSMAEALWKSLPQTSSVSRWGDEIYFAISVEPAGGEKKEVVEKGDIAFWAPGKAFCIFFGPTPMSQGEEIRAASPVIMLGKVQGSLEEFKKVQDGDEIRLEKV
ncbi:hypothetical protein KAS10_02555 [Candidatus Aerophobetes bacterium]|nr:hypothetical protein [Candidatus Aerophobetes bacterium]